MDGRRHKQGRLNNGETRGKIVHYDATEGSAGSLLQTVAPGPKRRVYETAV